MMYLCLYFKYCKIISNSINVSEKTVAINYSLLLFLDVNDQFLSLITIYDVV